jgi:hypothetical protein
MLGYGYEIIYKKGKQHVVVDSLSRQFEEEKMFQNIVNLEIYANRRYHYFPCPYLF